MKLFSAHHKLLAVFTVLFIVVGCKQPETIVINENPTAAAPSDTTVQDEVSSNEASFRKLVVGEYNSIPSMDPLLADNPSSMRAIQLVFEGLTRLNANGSVVPGLAESWDVTDDSLTYTFKLRNRIYYQDSDIFSTGTGRRLTSGDVKFVFERMAQTGVPPIAAHLFMGIEGFEPYFQEQHEVYLPKNRTLDGVPGIQTPSDSTIVFKLTSQDPQFLKKLATPLAVIYPREAVGGTSDSFSAVGSGPFQFSSQVSDSALIFSKFKNYYAASQIKLDRVDIISSSSESKLFQAMSRGEILMMPEMGPQTLPVLLKSDGSLHNSYAERYQLINSSGTTEYALRHNPSANLSFQNAQAIAALATSNTAYFDKFPDGFVTPQTATDVTGTSSAFSAMNKQLSTTFSGDPFVKTYLGSLASILDQNGITLQMKKIRTPSRKTGLFFTQAYPLIGDARWNSYESLFKFWVTQLALQRKEINGFELNSYPWWFNLRGVTLPALENLN